MNGIRENLTITRFAYSQMGTFGKFVLPSNETLYTVERPWMNNEPENSCIPIGEYQCRPRRYNRGGYDAVEVCDVPGRSYILFHRGNTMHHSAGCILVNSNHGCLSGMWAGIHSRNAFDEFMEWYGDREFTLTIANINAGELNQAA